MDRSTPPATLPYPPSRAEPARGGSLHGRWFDDPYAWLEQLADPDTVAWIDAQEDLTRSVLAPVPARAWLHAEVERATRFARRSIPLVTPHGVFSWHADPTDEKPKLVRQRSPEAPFEVVLDPNTWAADEVLAFAVPSPDGTHVAFGKAVGSSHDARIQVLEVERGRILPDRPRGTAQASVAWLPDGSGFFYAACPEPGEVPPGEETHWNAIHEHRLGASVPAQKVFGDAREKAYWCAVEVSECGRFAILTKWDFVHANDVHLLRLSDRALLDVATGMRSIQRVQVLDDALLIHTDRDAPRGKVCTASLTTPSEWSTLIPEADDLLQTVTGIGGHLYAVSSVGGAHRIRVHARDGAFLREVALPSPGSVNVNTGEGVVSGVTGRWRSAEVWVQFTSLLQPPSLYHYDFEGDSLTAFHVPEVDLDASAYVSKLVHFPSADGSRLSMLVTHHRDLPLDGQRPVRLCGYGGFNIALESRFSALNAAWLKLGGVVALAHVRGGGEYGRAWHMAAVKTRRQRAFDDFIASARWLVSAGYTSPQRLLARGNSNGGLLVMVAAMQAPEAFGAVFSRAPTLDLLTFPRFSHLAAAISEYGDPADPIEGAALAAYSPYHNVRRDRPYPPMALVSALNDQLAPPGDPLRMTARLQAEAVGGPFLLVPLRSSGHAGGTTSSALIRQDVDELCFACWALGAEPPSVGQRDAYAPPVEDAGPRS